MPHRGLSDPESRLVGLVGPLAGAGVAAMGGTRIVPAQTVGSEAHQAANVAIFALLVSFRLHSGRAVEGDGTRGRRHSAALRLWGCRSGRIEMSNQGEDLGRRGLTVVPELLEKEPKRNIRRPKIEARSRLGVIRRSRRRRPKEGRYRIKQDQNRAGFEEQSRFPRRRHSCRKRLRRKSPVPLRWYLSVKRREVRAASNEELREKSLEALTMLNDLRIAMELHFMERLLDGCPAERIDPGPVLPSQWKLAEGDPSADWPLRQLPVEDE